MKTDLRVTNVSPAPPSQRNPADLRLGWVQIGNSETSPVTVRVGRQPLSFGEGRLVSDPNWSNVGRSFDAVRMTVHYGPVRLDAFTGASDKIAGAGLALPTPGSTFTVCMARSPTWFRIPQSNPTCSGDSSTN
ncbi:MAG: alginate export family protein [Acidobacteriia bacterium]|nr:alginate export family protein [Terriglobia bacterium]